MVSKIGSSQAEIVSLSDDEVSGHEETSQIGVETASQESSLPSTSLPTKGNASPSSQPHSSHSLSSKQEGPMSSIGQMLGAITGVVTAPGLGKGADESAIGPARVRKEFDS